VAFDARNTEITVTVCGNKIRLVVIGDMIGKMQDGVFTPFTQIDPLKTFPQSLTLGRDDIDRSNRQISRYHFSIVFYGGRYYLFDHSANGTIVEFAERQNQSQEPPVREEGKVENVRTPQLILKRVGHPEQQIPDDDNSVGGDYYLFGEKVVSAERKELLEKGGNAVVLMDTATRQTAGQTPITTTRPFAQKFLIEYYKQIDNGKNPQKAMESAYGKTYSHLGEETEATFTFVTVVGDTAYCLWVGNTEAVAVGKDGSVHPLASSKEMVGERYYDHKTGTWVSPTILVSSGLEEKKESSSKLSPGDKIYVYTDGVQTLNPINPRKSSLKSDDAVIVEL